jgi:hypothetical protein
VGTDLVSAVTIVPPTRVTSVYDAPSTNARTSGVLTVQNGDLLVVLADRENASDLIADLTSFTNSLNLTNDGAALTWNLRIGVPATLNDARSLVRVWTTVVTENRTVTLTVDDTVGGGWFFGALFQVWRNHGGVGAVASNVDAGSAPSLNITTTADNSALVVTSCDWNAVDGASRAWRTGAGTLTEEGYDIDAVAPRKVLTLPQAEKILKRDGKAIPDGFTEQPEPNGTKLVRTKNAKSPVESPAARAAMLADRLMKL